MEKAFRLEAPPILKFGGGKLDEMIIGYEAAPPNLWQMFLFHIRSQSVSEQVSFVSS